ncbi:MAG TPA: TlpA disulfide reductase family protein [Blastocatellia bacterium]|nr:TlpA disulfide reductase family protein [Blastocatellia bacterium]
MGEVPLLKELYAQYRDKGVVVVGISLDEELKPLLEMVSAKGISWLQIHDADKSVAKLFNVKGTPTYFLLDREAKIAAKDITMKKLGGAIDDLLRK